MLEKQKTRKVRKKRKRKKEALMVGKTVNGEREEVRSVEEVAFGICEFKDEASTKEERILLLGKDKKEATQREKT